MSEENQEQSTPLKPTKIYNISIRLGIYAGVTFLSVLSKVYPVTAILAASAVVGFVGYLLIDTLKDITAHKAQRPGDSFWVPVIHGNAQEFFYLLGALIVGLFVF